MQDEVADTVAATISKKLEIELARRTLSKPPSSLMIDELTLRGAWHYFEYAREGCDKAIDCVERALAEDPDYPEALLWFGLSKCLRYEIDFDLRSLGQGLELIERVFKMDPTDSRAFSGYSANCGWSVHGLVQARAAVEQALRLNPNNYYAIAQRALVAVYDDQIDAAKDWLASLKKLTPHAPPWIEQFHSIIAFHEGRYREALTGLTNDDFAWQTMNQIACYGHLGERHDAQAIVARFAAQGRALDFHAAAAREPYVDRAARERLIEGIRLALG